MTHKHEKHKMAKNNASVAPSSTVQNELIQSQGHELETPASHESQLETPAPLHVGVGPERRVFFNDIISKWMFWIIIFPMDGFIGLLRAYILIIMNVHLVRPLFFLFLQVVQLFWEVGLMLLINKYDHTSVLWQWCAISFISFVLMGYEFFSILEVKYYPERYALPGDRGKTVEYGSEEALKLYQIFSVWFLWIGLYRVIVFLSLMIFLVHVVNVYMENERLRMEDEATPRTNMV